MIKKLFGTCAAAAIVALLVLIVLRHDRFHSMISFDSPTEQTPTEKTAAPETQDSAAADTSAE